MHVEFTGLDVYLGQKRVLQSVSGGIQQNRVVGIWGPNGAGKSTLLEVLAGWREPREGRICWSNDFRRRPILVPADAKQMLFPWYHVGKNLSIYRELAVSRGCDPRELSELENRVCLNLDVTGFLDRYPYELSSGEQARIAIACAFLYRPSVLMLDEVFIHIDWKRQESLANYLLEEFSLDGSISIVLVSHALNPFFLLAREIWRCESGTLSVGVEPNVFFSSIYLQLSDARRANTQP